MGHVHVLLDIHHPLLRDLIAKIVKREKHWSLDDYNTDDAGSKSVDVAISSVLRKKDRRLAVITAVQNYGGVESCRNECERWLMEFPELLVIAIDLSAVRPTELMWSKIERKEIKKLKRLCSEIKYRLGESED